YTPSDTTPYYDPSINLTYFVYNALGERVARANASGAKYYTWDGTSVVTERVSGVTTQRLIRGTGPLRGKDTYVMQDVGTGSKVLPMRNFMGTTMRMTNTAGTVVNSYEYDAWGQPFQATEGVVQQYRYRGLELDLGFFSGYLNDR